MIFKKCNATFNKIDETKQLTILHTSTREFACHGFESANINVIARKSKVSVGAMYKYFNTKRDLYLTCVEYTVQILGDALTQLVAEDQDFLSMLDGFIRAIQHHSRVHADLTQLYNEMTTEGNAEFIHDIVMDVEGLTAQLYAAYIKTAMQTEGLRPDINERYFAFFIDNLFMMLQFSYSCEYYKERLKRFVHPDALEHDETMREQLMQFIKGALYLK